MGPRYEHLDKHKGSMCTKAWLDQHIAKKISSQFGNEKIKIELFPLLTFVLAFPTNKQNILTCYLKNSEKRSFTQNFIEHRINKEIS